MRMDMAEGIMMMEGMTRDTMTGVTMMGIIAMTEVDANSVMCNGIKVEDHLLRSGDIRDKRSSLHGKVEIDHGHLHPA